MSDPAALSVPGQRCLQALLTHPAATYPAWGFALSPHFIFLLSPALLWTPALQEKQPDFQKAVEVLSRVAEPVSPAVARVSSAGELTLT